MAFFVYIGIAIGQLCHIIAVQPVASSDGLSTIALPSVAQSKQKFFSFILVMFVGSQKDDNLIAFLCEMFSQTPPASAFRKLEPDGYSSLPRQSGGNHNNNNNSIHNNGSPSTTSPSAAANKRAVVFGKHFQLPSLRVNSKRSSSAPNLGDGSSRRTIPSRNVLFSLAVFQKKK